MAMTPLKPLEEMHEIDQLAWQSALRKYLQYQNHTGRHMYRWIVSPINPEDRIIGCWKCGKIK